MDEARLDFTDQLDPGDGYRLAACVGTTYSLDLGTVLGACMALAGEVFRSGSVKGNPVGAFAAIAKLRGKVFLFCEKGRVRNESGTGRLAVLLEPFVNQVVVRRPRSAGASMSSFHPKVWLLDYVRVGGGSHRYRLLVTSRNLTFSSAWDVAACLDGYDTGKPVPESLGIARFLDYLRTSSGVEGDRETRKALKQLAETVSRVRFEVDSAYFDDYEFLPFGPANSGLLVASESPLFTEKHTKAVVVSPFLGNEGPLKRLADNRVGSGAEDRFRLFSREAALAKLDEGLRAKYTCYAPKAWLADVSLEDCGEGVSNASDYSDLHAKLYFTERNADRNLYLGSMNASRNGMTGNVEALLRLGVKKRGIRADDLVEALAGDGKPFGILGSESPVPGAAGLAEGESSRHVFLDRCFHAAAKLFDFKSVEVLPGEERMTVRYSLPLFKGFDADLKLSLAPYLAHVRPAAITSPAGEAVFGGVAIGSESEFFVLNGTSEEDRFDVSCIVRCPDSAFHCGEDRDARAKRVLEGILDADPGALASYVALAFGFQPPGTGAGRLQGAALGGGALACGVGAGIYETLLRSLAEAPDAREQLEYASLMLSFLPWRFDNARVEAMRNMVEQFEKAVRRRG